MMEIIRDAPFEKGPDGKNLRQNLCTIYAYCILDNHVHILIREGELNISDLMQRIELRYAVYYNRKYERIGHLFQGNFESEPVGDNEYFYTLLRYIHRNPVKAQEARCPEDYPYSSWNEYVLQYNASGSSAHSKGNDSHSSNLFPVLKPSAIQAVLKRYPIQDLILWVNLAVPNAQYTEEDLAKADNCLDMDRFPNPLSDREAFEILSELSGLTNPEDFRQLDHPTQTYYLLQAIDRGITLRQASRLGTLSYYLIRKSYNQKQESEKRGDSPTTGPSPSVDKNVEILSPALAALKRAMDKIMKNNEEDKTLKILQQAQDRIRHIEGLSKKTYHRMHLIAEYLSQHPCSKCQDIAEYINASPERARILLVQLSNANIVDIQGNARARTYTLHTPRKQ